jgi:hypothetical protein
MVEAVTNYIARRLIEREKAIAADVTVEEAARAYVQAQNRAADEAPEGQPTPKKRRPLAAAFAMVTELIGLAVLVALIAIGAREVWNYVLAWWMGQ